MLLEILNLFAGSYLSYKFTGHSRRLHISHWILSGMQFYSLRLLKFFPRLYLSNMHLTEISIFRAYIKREYFIDLSTGFSSKSQNFQISYRCLFCQQSSKKGEIVRASFAPEGFGHCWRKQKWN